MSAESKLEILEERVLCAIPRGNKGEELRVTFTRARTQDGKEVAWHGLRVWYEQAGKKLPSKSGITVRGKELGQVAITFLRAVSASVPRELHGSAKAIVAAIEAAA